MNARISLVFLLYIVFASVSHCSDTLKTFFDSNATVSSNITQLTLEPVYANAVSNEWGVYFQASSNTTECTGAETGWRACIHGALHWRAVIDNESSCQGIQVSDNLSAFQYVCLDNGSSIEVRTNDFSPGSGLINFIDYANGYSWKNIVVTVNKNGVAIARTIEKQLFAATVIPVTQAMVTASPPGATEHTFTGTKTIYVLSENIAGATLKVSANNVTVLAQPSITITGPAGAPYSYADFANQNFLYFESTPQTLLTGKLVLNTIKYSTARNLYSVGTLYTNNTNFGLDLQSTSNVTVRNLVVTNNHFGIRAQGNLQSFFENVRVFNNNDDGYNLSNVNQEMIHRGLQVHSNGDVGIENGGTHESNIFINTASSRNLRSGFGTSSAGMVNTSLVSYFSFQNDYAMYIENASHLTFADIMATDATNPFDAEYANTDHNFFTGTFLYQNGCDVSGGTNPGIANLTCAVAGPSSDHNPTQEAGGLATSFLGAVASDSMNQVDQNGTASGGGGALPVVSGIDWLRFDNEFRHFGHTTRVNCQTPADTCQIHDTSLSIADSKLRAVFTQPSGNNTLSHRWTKTSLATCNEIPGAIWGNACDVPPFDNTATCVARGGTLANRCISIYLRHAYELSGDAIGNDNALCESNEVCVFSPNIGAYQGHGPLVSLGDTFVDGTITGVQLYRYSNNGR